MPTGYTADIEKGIDFNTFVMNCAKAFGACITLRDEPMGGDAIPEEFKPSIEYYDKAIENIRAELINFGRMSSSEIKSAYDKYYLNQELKRIKAIEQCLSLKEKYTDMLNKVIAWNPPSEEHYGLKAFMEEQLKSSIDFDCDYSFYNKPTEHTSPSVWAQRTISKLTKDLERLTDEKNKEITRAAERTKWVRQLRESLQRN